MLTNDGVAAIIVTIMLIPQSLAYAMLAGLPAGNRPVCLDPAADRLCDIRDQPNALAVGPVAVVSLMTLTAASAVAPPGSRRISSLRP
jgi:SulP family sulfate permease